MNKQTQTNLWLILLGALATVPVLVSASLTFELSLSEIEQSMGVFLLIVFVNIVIFLAVAVLAGSRAAKFLDVKAWDRHGFFLAFFASIGLAAFLTAATVAIKTYAPEQLELLSKQPLKFVLLSSAYQAFTVEIFFRWFLVSVLGALFTLVRVPKTASMVGAILIASIIASLFSLPSTIISTAGGTGLTQPAVIASMLALFTIPNIVYGLLFWRKSLAAASLAHLLTFLLYNFMIFAFLKFTIL